MMIWGWDMRYGAGIWDMGVGYGIWDMGRWAVSYPDPNSLLQLGV